PPQSTEYLPRCHRKRCVPSRGKWLQPLANTQNCDAWTVQANPTPSDPLQQDYAHSSPYLLPMRVLRLNRSYHSAPLLVRSLQLLSLGTRRSLRDATRMPLDSTDRRRLANRGLPYETERLPSARSE